MYAFNSEVLGEQGTLGRKSQHEVMLTRHFRLALKRLNPWMNDKQLAEALERMTNYMSSQTLMQINEEKYAYLRDGVPATRQKPNGETETVKARMMDFANVDNNEFICVRELWIKGPIHKRRADVVCFVNGIPLIFIELKNLLKTDFSQNPGTFSVLFRHHEFYSLVSFHYICGFRTSAGQQVAVHALNRLTI